MPRGAGRTKSTENTPTPNEENIEMTENTPTETADTEKAARVTRTPAERAQARLDSANKKLSKATARRDKIAASIGDAEKDVARAARLVEFCKDDEDLPAQDESAPVVVDGDDEDLSQS